MRHGNRLKKLGRTHAHRKATLAALSKSLLEHKRITTTLPKAKALRTYVEPIINRAKDDTTHNRRQVFRRLQSKEAVKALFGEVAEVLGDRPGGYTRVVKLGQRAGDAAEMAIIELVDFNDVKPDDAATTKKKTRRSRGKSSGAEAPAAATAAVAEASDEVVVAEEQEAAEVIDDASAELDEDVAVEDPTEAGAAEAEEAVGEAGLSIAEAEDVAETEEIVEEVPEAEITAEDSPEVLVQDSQTDDADATNETDEEKAG